MYHILYDTQYYRQDLFLWTERFFSPQAGTSRTRITAILNDDLEYVSTDLLIRILASLGYRVKVSVTRADTAA
jgi:hypothetical protein